MFDLAYRSISFMIVIICMTFAAGCGSEPAREEAPEVVASVPAPASLSQAKEALAAAKATVADDGDYLCCVEPSCDWCLLHEGECKCRETLEAGKEVCAGCGLGWHNGEGIVEGVKAADVKWNIVHSHEEAAEHAH